MHPKYSLVTELIALSALYCNLILAFAAASDMFAPSVLTPLPVHSLFRHAMDASLTQAFINQYVKLMATG